MWSLSLSEVLPPPRVTTRKQLFFPMAQEPIASRHCSRFPTAMDGGKVFHHLASTYFSNMSPIIFPHVSSRPTMPRNHWHRTMSAMFSPLMALHMLSSIPGTVFHCIIMAWVQVCFHCSARGNLSFSSAFPAPSLNRASAQYRFVKSIFFFTAALSLSLPLPSVLP